MCACAAPSVGRPMSIDRLPVGDGRAGEPGVVQALACPEQDRVALGGPEQDARDLAEPGRAVAQGLAGCGRHRLRRRPGLEQGVGGGEGGRVALGGRAGSCRLAAWTSSWTRTVRAALVVSMVTRPSRPRACTAVRACTSSTGAAAEPAQVRAGSRGGEHRAGDAIGVQHGDQRKHRPRRRAAAGRRTQAPMRRYRPPPGAGSGPWRRGERRHSAIRVRYWRQSIPLQAMSVAAPGPGRSAGTPGRWRGQARRSTGPGRPAAWSTGRPGSRGR